MRFATVSDIPRIEEICNDPVIRVWTACDGAPACDAAKYVSAPSFTILGDEGCFLLHCLDKGRYAVHTNLLPAYRGELALAACKEALAMVFLATDALELVTYVPKVIPQAAVMARTAGFRHLFDRAALWPVQGELYSIGFYGMSLDDWVIRGHCKESGERFHERLHVELGAPSHADDPPHNCYVGAAVEMILAGNVRKGVTLYNRFARFAGYQPVKVVSTDPLRIDIRDCVLRVEGDSFYREAENA